MEEFRIYSKNELKNYTLEELEALKKQEKAYLENGEALLKAMLNTPFKSKEKFEKIKKRISYHSNNISIINELIGELKATFYTPSAAEIAAGNDISNNVSAYNVVIKYSNELNVPLKTTFIKYINEYNDEITLEVIDDIFQSVLNNYYMIDKRGNIIPLEKIIEINEDSLSGKWYKEMLEKYIKTNKIKRSF